MLSINGHSDRAALELNPLYNPQQRNLFCVHYSMGYTGTAISEIARYIYKPMIQRYCHFSEYHDWSVKTRLSTVYRQLKFDEIQNDYLIQILVFLAGIKLKKKKKLLLKKVNLLISF